MNIAESAKNFKNILKTLAVKSQKNLASREKHGLFSEPTVVFPGQSSAEVENIPLLQSGDQVYDKVMIKGTNYSLGQVLILKVVSVDVLEVGTIEKVLFRNNTIFFLVKLSDAVRHRLGFFETLSLGTLQLIEFNNLADYKPLIKRGEGDFYPFILHHHVPTLLND